MTATTAPRLSAKSLGLAFGHVKTFNAETGFGFIRTTHDADAFMRIQDLFGTPDEYRPGDLVEFRLYQGERGWFAREVARLPNDPVVVWAWRKLDAMRW